MILLLVEKEADCLTSQIKEQRISVNHPQPSIRRAPTAERFSPVADNRPFSFYTYSRLYLALLTLAHLLSNHVIHESIH